MTRIREWRLRQQVYISGRRRSLYVHRERWNPNGFHLSEISVQGVESREGSLYIRFCDW